ncbi:MAG: DNA polymerase III subunit beta [Clostridiales bacterium]|nr:DNA polymerase III subunit beta [Clostridiales bacterium]
MKIVCKTEELFEACQNVERVVSTKTSIPAIEGILLKAENDKLFLTGYDLEVGINTSLDVKVESSGSIILNARLLCDILRKLPDEKVIIESDERQLTVIKSGAADYKLVGIDANEYPELPSVIGGFPVVLSQELLKNMIRQTIFAVAPVASNNKVVHTGVKFEIEDKMLKLIAVDGFRLSIRTEPLANYDGENMSFIVPAKTLSEVLKLIGEENADISIGVGKRHIVFDVNGYNIVSRLLDGEFLDYKSAIPKSFDTTVNVSTKLLSDSIERTSLLITDRIKSPVKFIFDEDSIKISSITALGSASDKITAEIEGPRVEIGFNNKFIIDALKASDTDKVRIKLNNSTSPIIILPVEGESFIFLVLPVRLKNEN